jgi:hypothetical protein
MKDKRSPRQMISGYLQSAWLAPAEYPVFLAVASWFELGNGVGIDDKLAMIEEADLVKDRDYHPDGQSLYGFAKDTKGIAAFNCLRSLVECDAVFIHDGQHNETEEDYRDGDYLQVDDDFLEESGLYVQYDVDYRNVEVLKEFVDNFIRLAQQRHPFTVLGFTR